MAVPRTPNTAAKPGINPWLVAFVVSMATFMEVLDTSIANVSLNHIAGNLGAGHSQATWVLTSYLAANAIVIPISGWLSDVMGRKRFYMTCVAVFTLSSFFCGIAPTLGALLFFRVFQGAGGGGLSPSEQSMLADTFPGKYFGMAFAIYGVAVVVAPAVGPVLGGWITDNWSWRWIFLINIPVGLASLALTHRLIQDPQGSGEKRARSPRLRVDYMGFSLVALGFGALQVVLDKGQELDWFGSGFIVLFTVLTVLGIGGMVLWETRVAKDPVVDLSLLKDPNLASSMFLQFVVGFLINATTVLIPSYTQQLLGYNATHAGLVLMPGGLTMFLVFPLAGRLVTVIQPKYLMAAGLLVAACALSVQMTFYDQVGYAYLVRARVIMCIGVPFLFLPLNTIAYGNLPPGKSNSASAMMNLLRNLGGSIGISLAETMVIRGAQIHQVYLTAHASLFHPEFVQRMQRLGGITPKTLALVYQGIQAQAGMLAYMDVFRFLVGTCLLSLLPVLMLRRAGKDEKPVMGH